MSIFWFVTFILLLMLELGTIQLVSIWFALGAVVTCFFSLFVDHIVLQITVFIIASVISLLLTKPFIRKLKDRKIVATNLDRVIGEKAVVLQEICPYHSGSVRVLGSIWTAVSDEEIPVDCEVIIERIEGVKVVVRKID